MSAAEFTATVKRAFEVSSRSRLRVGLKENKKPPRRYRVTLYLSPGTYLAALDARGVGQSLTKYCIESIENRAVGRKLWLQKRRLTARLAA
jgi:hypothetical protein